MADADLLARIDSALPPAASVAGLPVLMAHDQNSNAAFKLPVNDRVREDLQRKGSSSRCRWCAKVRVFNQELGDAFEFFEKARSNRRSSLFAVKIQGVGNVSLRPRVERVSHRASRARSRTMASCPGTSAIEPDSNSASRRSASRSQASSTSGSESRLAINLSSRCDRSTGAKRRTSASSNSRFVLTLTSATVDA